MDNRTHSEAYETSHLTEIIEALQYSPKPWYVLDGRLNGEEFLSIVTLESDEPVVARIKNSVSNKPINQNDIANAYLISAAPDLFEAIFGVLRNRVLGEDGRYQSVVDHDLILKAEEAFCKALGEPKNVGPIVHFEGFDEK